MAICQVDGCQRNARARGWCKYHYERWRTTGSPIPTKRLPKKDALCSVETCDKLAVTRGWCGKHYRRWLKHGDPLYERPSMPNICIVDGCIKRAEVKSMCQAHYVKWKKYGDPTFRIFDGLATAHQREYHIWAAMKQRCNNPKSAGYKDYGGRGIKVCDRWNGPTCFKNFYRDMGDCPDGCSLDRIDVDKGYSPNNCRWANWNVQAANKKRSNKTSGYNGVSKLGNKWKAELTVSGMRYWSIHEQEEDAHRARLEMERRYLGGEILV